MVSVVDLLIYIYRVHVYKRGATVYVGPLEGILQSTIPVK